MILLDTHVVIWLAESPDEISLQARAAIDAERTNGELAIAGRTLWEIAFLVSRKRVFLSNSLSQFLNAVETSFKVLALTSPIAEQSVLFSPAYPKDPSDQVIGATAIVHGIPLVTADGSIRACGEVPCIW